jgi:hypothetical protein
MNAGYFIADELASKDGYTWTLPSRLGSMLHEAEQLFGPRDRSYTILGVEFGPGGPQVWYPRPERKHVVVQLSRNALKDEVIALYQLAHECIHLLSPSGRRAAPVIEEGLATVFSEDFVRVHFNRTGMTNLSSYMQAASWVRQLIAMDSTAILKMRNDEPSFRSLTARHFNKHFPDIDDDLVAKLVSPFVRDAA